MIAVSWGSATDVGKIRQVNEDNLVANGNNSMLASLPTGEYKVSAADIPSAKAVSFTVGPYRSSSQNDLLLP